MPVTYSLVNPQVLGSMKTTIKTDNSLKAARTFYKSLSEHFNNTIPQFNFTIQKGTSGKGKYYHFKVSENKKGDEIDFTLEQSNIDDKETIERFETKLSQFKGKCSQAGGGSKPDDTDTMFDNDDGLKTLYSIFPTVYDYPIGYFWYDPHVYNLDFYYIPTFYNYITPFIQISM